MDLTGRHFLKLLDYTPEEINYLIDLAAELKRLKKAGIPVDTLRGKNVALIFPLRLLHTILAWDVPISIRPAPRSAKKRASATLHAFWDGCLKESNTAVTDRKS